MYDSEKLEKLACKELDKLMDEGKMNPSVAEYAQLLTDIVKNVKKIEMLDEGGDDDYSERSYRRGGSRQGSRESRESRESGRYERGGSRRSLYEDYSEQRRDSRGRFSRAGGRDHLIAEMGELMSDAETEEERKVIEKALRELQR